MHNVTVQRGVHALRIFIRGVLHLELLMESYDGMQAWKQRAERFTYRIEFYRKSGAPVLCEYEDEVLWREILDGLAKGT